MRLAEYHEDGAVIQLGNPSEMTGFVLDQAAGRFKGQGHFVFDLDTWDGMLTLGGLQKPEPRRDADEIHNTGLRQLPGIPVYVTICPCDYRQLPVHP